MMDLVPIITKLVGAAVMTIIIGGLVLRSRYFRNLPIWTIMAFAAFVSIAGGLVNPDDVSEYISWNTILFLIGMFSIGALANSSGLLEYMVAVAATKARSPRSLIVVLTVAFGLIAAFFVNDAVAAMGSLIVVPLAKAAGLDPELLILVLAFSVTIGSTMTPLGNPQNMLIAVDSGMRAPLLEFMEYLAVPTVVNLLVTGYLLARLYNVTASGRVTWYRIPEEAIRNRRDAVLAGGAILVVVVALLVNNVLQLLRRPAISEEGIIPFTVAAATYVLSSNPRETIKEVNWGTIVFFITMFIAMDGLWGSGLITPLFYAVLPAVERGLDGILRISLASLAFSQLLSNVPFVELFITYMQGLGYGPSYTMPWVTLAMASTIAGNLTILGAASNVIILEGAESNYGVSVSYWKFMKIGALVTLVNTLIYLAFMIPLYYILTA